MKRVAGAGYLEYWMTDSPPFDYIWDRTNVLRFMRPGDAHTVESR